METIGYVPAELVREASDGKVNEPWPAQINTMVLELYHLFFLSLTVSDSYGKENMI